MRVAVGHAARRRPGRALAPLPGLPGGPRGPLTLLLGHLLAPGTAQALGKELVAARGWGDDQFACLLSLWNQESGWRVNAANRSSGAYGIPQALPGSKMASVGADWQTNPATQITWGLNYIGGRYGNPCGAWAHHESAGWY